MTTTPPPLTADEIAALRKLHEEATAGPWKACGCGRCGLVWSLPLDTTIGNRTGKPGSETPGSHSEDETPARQQAKNAELVAALFNAAPSLLSACERLARVDRFLEEHVDTVEEYLGYSSSGPVNDALKAFRALRTEKR